MKGYPVLPSNEEDRVRNQGKFDETAYDYDTVSAGVTHRHNRAYRRYIVRKSAE